MRIISVNVGSIQDIEIRGKKVPTGIFKEPVEGRQWVSIEGLRGDVRVEARKLGERDHAVHAYPHEHYAHWKDYLGREQLSPGQFGENLTVTGLLETDVRVGDVFQFGTSLLQVTHPRIPCRKLDARLGEGFKRVFLESRRVGYYLRVLKPGQVAAGDRIELVETDPSSPTLNDFIRFSQFDYWDAAGLESLLRAKDLSERSQDILHDKLARARTAEGWFGLRELEIVRRREECETAASFDLRCARSRPLPGFRAGQDLTLAFRPDPGGPLHRRAAALSSDPDKSSYRMTVGFGDAPSSDDTDCDPVSEFLRRLEPGDTIRATEPQGWFTLDASAASSCEKMVFVSEGIGIASIITMLHTWSTHHSRIPAMFVHEGSGRGFGLLKSEAENIASAAGNLTIGNSGSFRELRANDLGETGLVFAAGRGRFVSQLQDECFALGLDHTRVRIKRVAK